MLRPLLCSFLALLPFTASAQSLVPPVKDPAVSIVVFAAFDCGYCAQSQAMLDTLKQKYAGKLSIAFKHFPVDLSETGVLPHEAALAAAEQGQFIAMHDALFAKGSPRDRRGIEKLAAELKLDLGRFRDDLDRHAGRARIDADRREAEGFGVKVTPTFYVQGFKLEGLHNIDVFTQIIDHQLASDSIRPEVPAGGAP
ncbi:DsbA family protein [Tahibacter amnicola]|uniref:DsbA family protein n=1 Tax=Tahibacter amnicola TaxID=2976241 RepID=A0ABY6BFY4_9GAMM|nr:DsbA family protein [Tahibacter amnicola]UXI68188.1 DsbA family protein [Tahibacter amnicola]